MGGKCCIEALMQRDMYEPHLHSSKLSTCGRRGGCYRASCMSHTRTERWETVHSPCSATLCRWNCSEGVCSCRRRGITCHAAVWLQILGYHDVRWSYPPFQNKVVIGSQSSLCILYMYLHGLWLHWWWAEHNLCCRL